MSLKVLLADDSMTAQNMAKKILADSGYEVTTVSNGAAAVKKIAEVKPDLVILDIYMPGYTGLEVCERVRASAETSKLPVLLTVGKMEPYRPEDGARVRADGIIVKPFEATDLLGIVKKLSEKLTPAPKSIPVPMESFVDEPAVENTESEYGDFKAATAVEVPAEMAVAPAMAFEELPVAGEGAHPGMDAIPHGFMPVAPVDVISGHAEPGTSTDAMPAYIEAEISAVSTPAELETFAPEAETDIVTTEPEIEFTSVQQEEAVEVQPVPEFEPTVRVDETTISNAEHDPALVTEPDQITQFATTFGVENAEEVPVGTVTGNEPFFDATSPELEISDVLKAEDVFPQHADQHLDTELEPETPEIAAVETTHSAATVTPAAEPVTQSGNGTVDDFEARVAAAMSAFDMPLEEPPHSEEPVIEQVDNFVADAELVNPSAPEPAMMESAPAESAAAPESVQLEQPVVPARPSLNVDETMVLPTEALLSLEAEMRKAMEFRQAAPEPSAPEQPLEASAESLSSEPESPVEVVENGAPEPPQVAEPEPAPAPTESQEPAVLAMAAAASSIVPKFDGFNGFGEEKLASAVHTAMERLKPQLIAEIVKALKGE